MSPTHPDPHIKFDTLVGRIETRNIPLQEVFGRQDGLYERKLRLARYYILRGFMRNRELAAGEWQLTDNYIHGCSNDLESLLAAIIRNCTQYGRSLKLVHWRDLPASYRCVDEGMFEYCGIDKRTYNDMLVSFMAHLDRELLARELRILTSEDVGQIWYIGGLWHRKSYYEGVWQARQTLMDQYGALHREAHGIEPPSNNKVPVNNRPYHGHPNSHREWVVSSVGWGDAPQAGRSSRGG